MKLIVRQQPEGTLPYMVIPSLPSLVFPNTFKTGTFTEVKRDGSPKDEPGIKIPDRTSLGRVFRRSLLHEVPPSGASSYEDVHRYNMLLYAAGVEPAAECFPNSENMYIVVSHRSRIISIVDLIMSHFSRETFFYDNVQRGFEIVEMLEKTTAAYHLHKAIFIDEPEEEQLLPIAVSDVALDTYLMWVLAGLHMSSPYASEVMLTRLYNNNWMDKARPAYTNTKKERAALLRERAIFANDSLLLIRNYNTLPGDLFPLEPDAVSETKVDMHTFLTLHVGTHVCIMGTVEEYHKALVAVCGMFSERAAF
jgi:hypothetical protein